jgi:hypothetical protein
MHKIGSSNPEHGSRLGYYPSSIEDYKPTKTIHIKS